jgi:hypothetical protein
MIEPLPSPRRRPAEYSVKIALTGFGAEERGAGLQANTKPGSTSRQARRSWRRATVVGAARFECKGEISSPPSTSKVETMPLNGRNYLSPCRARARRGDARDLSVN